MKKPIRQPMLIGSRLGLSRKIEAAAPIMAPAQYVPLTAMSVRPRYRAGISSSIAELIAVYSPPIPVPAMNRKMTRNHRFGENPAIPLASRYVIRVTRNSRRRPSRSVSQPKNSAPTTSPSRYTEPSRPTSAAVRCSVLLSWRTVPTVATIWISRPSRIQAAPSPRITRQWNLVHGRRSNRAGTSVLNVGTVGSVTGIIARPSLSAERDGDDH